MITVLAHTDARGQEKQWQRFNMPLITLRRTAERGMNSHLAHGDNGCTNVLIASLGGVCSGTACVLQRLGVYIFVFCSRFNQFPIINWSYFLQTDLRFEPQLIILTVSTCINPILPATSSAICGSEWLLGCSRQSDSWGLYCLWMIDAFVQVLVEICKKYNFFFNTTEKKNLWFIIFLIV